MTWGVELCGLLLGDKVEGWPKSWAATAPTVSSYVSTPAEGLHHRCLYQGHLRCGNGKEARDMLIGATNIGRDLGPRCAATLHTGLTADCTHLDVDVEKYKAFLKTTSTMDVDNMKFDEGTHLKMTRPAFGGHLMATIICPRFRPQMSTVRPGVMQRAPSTRPRLIRSLSRSINRSTSTSSLSAMTYSSLSSKLTTRALSASTQTHLRMLMFSSIESAISRASALSLRRSSTRLYAWLPVIGSLMTAASTLSHIVGGQPGQVAVPGLVGQVDGRCLHAHQLNRLDVINSIHHLAQLRVRLRLGGLTGILIVNAELRVQLRAFLGSCGRLVRKDRCCRCFWLPQADRNRAVSRGCKKKSSFFSS